MSALKDHGYTPHDAETLVTAALPGASRGVVAKKLLRTPSIQLVRIRLVKRSYTKNKTFIADLP